MLAASPLFALLFVGVSVLVGVVGVAIARRGGSGYGYRNNQSDAHFHQQHPPQTSYLSDSSGGSGSSGGDCGNGFWGGSSDSGGSSWGGGDSGGGSCDSGGGSSS